MSTFNPIYTINNKICASLQVIEAIYKKNGSFLSQVNLTTEDALQGYLAARKKIQEYAQNDEVITEDVIKTVHALVKRKKNSKSTYRRKLICFENSKKGIEIYCGPAPKKILGHIMNLILWLKTVDLPAPVKAAIFHYELVKIHPFNDGNGRTTRLLTSLLLHLNGYNLSHCHTLEEYFEKNKSEYRKALDNGPFYNPAINITAWIEYFCFAMLQNAKKFVN